MSCLIGVKGVRVIDGVTVGAKTVLLGVKQMIVCFGYTDESDQRRANDKRDRLLHGKNPSIVTSHPARISYVGMFNLILS
jgi:hypothetical protein